MKRTVFGLLVVVGFCLAAAGTAAAQDVTQPLTSHAERKVDAARADPVAFVRGNASTGTVGNESAWGVAYACFVIAKEHADQGTPDPHLAQCADYEEVLGIQKPNEEPKPVADVQNLTDDPVAQVQEVGNDASGTVGRVVDHPSTALDEILGLVHRAVGHIRDILDGLVGVVTDMVGGIGDLVGRALWSDAQLGGSIFGVSQRVAADAGAAMGEVLSAAGRSIADVGSGLHSLGDHAGSGASHAVRSVGMALRGVGRDVAHAWDRIFGAPDDAKRDVGPPADPSGPTGAADDLLGTLPRVGRVVHDATGH